MFYVFLILALFGTGIGLFPVPEDIIVLSAGAGIQQGLGNMFVVAGVIYLGLLASDFLIFWVSKEFGMKILNFKFVAFFIPRKKVERMLKFFDGHKKKVVFMGRFVSGLRPIVFFAAGLSGIKSSTFIAIDALAALVYIPLMLFFGYRLSYDISGLIGGILKIYHAIEILLILSVVFWIVLRLTKKFSNNGNKSGNCPK
ncbi:MAG: DedA family protein [bacterium]|nr:DedA family protein [bacterium]